jgi:hypothetical protein
MSEINDIIHQFPTFAQQVQLNPKLQDAIAKTFLYLK